MPERFPQVTLPHTEVRMLPSSIIAQEFKIFVALPEGVPEMGKHYPVLYVLDANGVFGCITEIIRFLQIRAELPEMIIVGIAYPVETFKETLGLRIRDLTPTKDPTWLEEYIKERPFVVGHGTGGARQFLQFIREELMPFIQSNYPVDLEDKAIAGSSFSGLFALYALFHVPSTFKRYMVGSPSMWWGDDVAFSFENKYAAENDDLAAKVFMSIGGLETKSIVSQVKKLNENLQSRNYENLELKMHIFEDETHLSVPAAAISRGLRVVYG